MKKKLLFILILLLFPVVVSASEHNYLYDVLKREAEEGTVAKEYTGEHNDTIGGGSSKIYHWYSETDANTNTINNKWNVLFGGYCWEILRTTDGGGTKLIYNGVPVNGTCKDDRTITTDYERFYYGSMYRNYAIASSYYYNENDGYYYLKDDIEISPTIDETNYKSILGKYTCERTDPLEGCSEISQYYDFSHKDEYAYYYLLRILPEPGSSYHSYYYSIGSYPFNTDDSNPFKVGYMYNDESDIVVGHKNITYGNYIVDIDKIPEDKYEVISNNSTNSFSFNTETKYWSASTSGTSSIKFKIKTAGDYILNYSFDNNYVELYVYKNDVLIKEMSYSATTWSNRNIKLDNVTTDDVFEVKFKERYSATLTFRFAIGSKNGEETDTRMAFGNSFIYEDGKYKLKDILYNDGTDPVNNNHYTCLSHNTECETVTYVLTAGSSPTAQIYAVDLKDGKDSSYAAEVLYSREDINKKDSMMKHLVERWFEGNMLDYENYLEPTVYCSRRTISNDDNYFNPNGGNDTPNFYGNTYNSSSATYEEVKRRDREFNTNLYCENITDQFSVLNSKAKLKYSVGLPNYMELLLSTKDDYSYMVHRKNNAYQTMSLYNGLMIHNARADGRIYQNSGRSDRPVRPVVSLKSNVEYESGTGTKEDPYIISNLMYSNIIKENDDNKGTLTINGDIEDIRNNTEVTFTVENKKGFNVKSVKVLDDINNEIELTVTGNTYKFNMPTSNVRIITEYTAVLNILNTLKNMNTALIAIILVVIGYGTYILIKKRK